MEVILLLADSAQTDPSGAKVHALGLGWDVTTSPTAPSAVVGLVQVPWNETNRQHHLILQLRDADGHPVQIPGPMGDQGVQVDADFEVGRPPGIPSGTNQSVKIACMLGPLPLSEGRYEWHASINGDSKDSWVAPFTVLPPGQQPGR